MKNERPSSIWVLGFEYRVHWDADKQTVPPWWSGTPEKFWNLVPPSADGFFDQHNHMIVVDASKCMDRQRETLLHETFHAIDAALNIGEGTWEPNGWSQEGKQNGVLAEKCWLTEDYLQQHTRTLIATMNDPRNVAFVRFIFQNLAEGTHP